MRGDVGMCGVSAERALCATCGHAFNGHQYPSLSSDPQSLACHHQDGCTAFIDSGESLPDERSGPSHMNPYQPNFWESDNHMGGAA